MRPRFAPVAALFSARSVCVRHRSEFGHGKWDKKRISLLINYSESIARGDRALSCGRGRLTKPPPSSMVLTGDEDRDFLTPEGMLVENARRRRWQGLSMCVTGRTEGSCTEARPRDRMRPESRIVLADHVKRVP